MADCDITNKKDKVIFKHTGENTCNACKLGYTLTCTGTEL